MKKLLRTSTERPTPDARRVFACSGTTDLVWSLTLPQMAATLASAVVAFKTINASGARLLDETYVNAVLVLVVVTCVAGPVLSERSARRVKDEPAPPDATETLLQPTVASTS